MSSSTVASTNKRIENKINELELSVEQKEDFITNFTHELKNPMTSIIGYADILKSGKYDKETKYKICKLYI